MKSLTIVHARWAQALRTLVAAAAVLAAAAVGAQTTKIVLGGAMPAKGPDSRALVAFAQKVDQQTNGTLKLDLSFDGQMVNFRTSLSGIRDGLVDAIQLYPVFYLSEFKLPNTMADLGVYASDAWAHAAASAEVMLLNCPQCDAEFARQKVKPLAVAGSTPFMLICKNPVRSAADLRGKSIRALGPNQALAKALGGNPVGTTPAEVFEALQRGQVECLISPLDWFPAYGLADVAKYVVDLPLTYDITRMPLAINVDVWRKLSPDHKQVLLRNVAFLSAEATANNLADGRAGRQLAEGKGVKFEPAPVDLAALVTTHRSGELARVARDAKTRGVADAEAFVATFRDKVTKWQKIVADTGGDRAKYEEALWREIYSKIK